MKDDEIFQGWVADGYLEKSNNHFGYGDVIVPKGNGAGKHTYKTVGDGGECGGCFGLVVDGEIVKGPPFHPNCKCSMDEGDIEEADEEYSELKDIVGPNRNVDPEDAKWVKESLHELGFYEPDKRAGETEDDINPFPNENMFDAIERFQKANKLEPNKIIKPGHWNEIKIKQALTEHKKISKDTDFKKAVAILLKAEGGYNNIKADRGGETNFGISKKAYPNEDIPNMTQERAIQIYYNDFWDTRGINKLSGALRHAVFDGAANHGSGKSVKMLQEVLGVNQDGQIDDETLKAIANYAGDLFRDYLNRRQALYDYQSKNVPAQDQFEKGWNNRIKELFQLRDTGKI